MALDQQKIVSNHALRAENSRLNQLHVVITYIGTSPLPWKWVFLKKWLLGKYILANYVLPTRTGKHVLASRFSGFHLDIQIFKDHPSGHLEYFVRSFLNCKFQAYNSIFSLQYNFHNNALFQEVNTVKPAWATTYRY